jgi:hypothetical protein
VPLLVVKKKPRPRPGLKENFPTKSKRVLDARDANASWRAWEGTTREAEQIRMGINRRAPGSTADRAKGGCAAKLESVTCHRGRGYRCSTPRNQLTTKCLHFAKALRGGTPPTFASPKRHRGRFNRRSERPPTIAGDLGFTFRQSPP